MSNFSKSVIVSVAVSSLGASNNIHVLEPGVKINGAYNRDAVLRQMLLPDIRAASRSCSDAGSRDARFYPTGCLAA